MSFWKKRFGLKEQATEKQTMNQEEVSGGNSRRGTLTQESAQTQPSQIPPDYVDVVSRLVTKMASVDLNSECEKALADAYICGEEIMGATTLEQCIASAPYSTRFKNWPVALAAVGAVRLAQIVRQIISVISEGQDLYGPQTVLANLQVPGNRQALRRLRQDFRSLAAFGAPEDLAALMYRYANDHPDDFKRFK